MSVKPIKQSALATKMASKQNTNYEKILKGKHGESKNLEDKCLQKNSRSKFIDSSLRIK